MFDSFTDPPGKRPRVTWSAVANVIGAICLWIGLSIVADLAPRGWLRELAKLVAAAIVAWSVYPPYARREPEDLDTP